MLCIFEELLLKIYNILILKINIDYFKKLNLKIYIKILCRLLDQNIIKFILRLNKDYIKNYRKFSKFDFFFLMYCFYLQNSKSIFKTQKNLNFFKFQKNSNLEVKI